MNLVDHNQVIPAGLIDTSVEFFLHEGEVNCMYNGQRYKFDDFPAAVIDPINEDLGENPEAGSCLVDWGKTDLQSQLRQYIACRHGGYDSRPDICVDGKIQPAEFVNCGRRGSCPYEGRLCTAIQVSEDSYLNQEELKTLRLIGEEHLDKEIADKLNISIHTVRHRKDSIAKKANLERKPALVGLAYRLGLVKNF